MGGVISGRREDTAAVDGEPSVVLAVHKQPEANTLLLTARIDQALDVIESSLPPGMTLHRSGFRQARFIEAAINNVRRHLLESAILVVILLTMFLTQTMSNAAAALVVLPVAMQTAETLGVSGQTFAIAVMLGASSSFIAPFEPACILVSGPGKYRFSDYLRTGSGLSILVALIVWMLVPVMWPLD